MKEIDKPKDTLLLNLYAGPGVGKSTVMAGVFSELKWRGVNCEMAPEFAKEKVWEESTKLLENQIYIFGKQLHTIHRVWGKVDVVITDSPLLLSVVYGEKEGEEFKNLVLAVMKRYRSLNVFLNRHKEYNPSGRLQTESQAIEIDNKIQKALIDNEVLYFTVDGDRNAVNYLADAVCVWAAKSNLLSSKK